MSCGKTRLAPLLFNFLPHKSQLSLKPGYHFGLAILKITLAGLKKSLQGIDFLFDFATLQLLISDPELKSE